MQIVQPFTGSFSNLLWCKWLLVKVFCSLLTSEELNMFFVLFSWDLFSWKKTKIHRMDTSFCLTILEVILSIVVTSFTARLFFQHRCWYVDANMLFALHNAKELLFWCRWTYPMYVHYCSHWITVQTLNSFLCMSALSWTNRLQMNSKWLCAHLPHFLSWPTQTQSFHDKSVCTSAKPSPSPFSLLPLLIQAPTHQPFFHSQTHLIWGVIAASDLWKSVERSDCRAPLSPENELERNWTQETSRCCRWVQHG